MADDAIVPVEPVHWGARLVRAPGTVYSEVAGISVVVRVGDGDLQPIPPAWAACWAALDGRPLTEALEVDPTNLDPITSRNLIEALRRMKASGLVCDVPVDVASPADHPDAADPSAQPVAGPTNVAFRGATRTDPGGLVLTIPASPRIPGSHDRREASTEPVGTVTVHLDEVDGSFLASTPSGQITSVELDAPFDTEDPEEQCVLVLAGLVAALEDTACLAVPGVLDLLAALAERGLPPATS